MKEHTTTVKVDFAFERVDFVCHAFPNNRSTVSVNCVRLISPKRRCARSSVLFSGCEVERKVGRCREKSYGQRFFEDR